jgi:hypothetical protein
MIRKSWIAGILAFLAVLADAAVTITPKDPSKLNGCYFITTKEELYGFAEIVNGTGGHTADPVACARLGADIVVNEGVLDADGNLNVADTANFAIWTPIRNFRGTFNGQFSTISGLYFNDESQTAVGLFGSVISDKGNAPATIEKVFVEESFIRGLSYVGAVVGQVYGGDSVIVNHAYNYSRIESKAYGVGGIVGFAKGTFQLKNCANMGMVYGPHIVGGIVGILDGSALEVDVRNAYNVGYVISRNSDKQTSYVGGVFGLASGILRLQNMYNLGYVSGYAYKGGIAGALGGSSVVLVNAYNAGPVVTPNENDANTGAIMGQFQGIAGDFRYANIYYQESDGYGDMYGVELPEVLMQNGTLAYLLHNYYYEGLDASIWGQDFEENDPYPCFRGEIKGAPALTLQDVTLHIQDDGVLTLSYVPGYSFTLPQVPHEGYVFRGWRDNAELEGDSVSFIPATATGPQEFWAKFAKIWSIAYWTGTTTTYFEENVPSYVEGEGVTLPKHVTQSGVVFNGWYDNKAFEGERYYKIGPEATGDKLLFARWLVKKRPAKGADGCYVITNASELYGFAAIVNGTDDFTKNNSSCASLGNDIVVNENVLKPDGTVNERDSADFMKWTPMEEFRGQFDGKGHTISGLYYNVESGTDLNLKGVGLFGVIRDGTEDSPVVIKNVGIEDSYFSGVFNVGALVGHVYRRYNYYDIYVNISNVYNKSTVMSHENGGGLVGTIAEYGKVVFENCYNAGLVSAMRGNAGGLVGATWMQSNVEVRNSYYLNLTGDDEPYGVATSMEQFGSGSVAYALHNGANGSVWGQIVGTDPLPNFSGVVTNFTPPSSSSVASSSSAKSSSSVRSSSSKANPVSSSSAKSSSSSGKAKSSSSGAKVRSSSSKGNWFIPIALPKAPQAPQFHISVDGLKVLLAGAREGCPYALFDMQGRTILSGRVSSSDFTISVPYAGSYLLRVGYQTARFSAR